MPARYILSSELQADWIETIKRFHSREWIAGLKLREENIEWFGFRVGEEHEVRPISLKDVPMVIGTVHYHPYPHSGMPIPSMDDGLMWIYSSYWEISDQLNPIFFMVFNDGYASWAMFPKPPFVREVWKEEFDKLGVNREKESEASWNLCLRFLEEDLIKAGVFHLGEKAREFSTF